MYVIEVYEEAMWVNSKILQGYFTNTYTAKFRGEKGTFVGYEKLEVAGQKNLFMYNITLYKSKTFAEKRKAKLESLVEENPYLSNLSYEVKVLDEEEEKLILNAKEKEAKKKKSKEIIYTAYSKHYLEQLLEIETEKYFNELKTEEDLRYREGRISIIKELVDGLD